MHTPLGFALLELQGTINFPSSGVNPPSGDSNESTEVGRLVFPDYDPAQGAVEGAWMKRAWLFVGFQRMTGSVVKLSKPLGVVRRRQPAGDTMEGLEPADGAISASPSEQLEILEIVRWKIAFRSRPEPVGLAAE